MPKKRREIKSYNDLPPQEEIELVLWLGFFEDSVNNAHMQIKRWEQTRNAWDLQMFFIAVTCMYDAIKCLGGFLTNDAEIWKILKEFKRKVEKYNLKKLRNDIVHPKDIFKNQDRQGNPLPKKSILILGAYLVDKDEFIFGTHSIKVSEAFDVVRTLTQEWRTVLDNRLSEFYETKELEGMIPFTHLRSSVTVQP